MYAPFPARTFAIWSLALAVLTSRANNITTSNGSMVNNTGTQVTVKFDVSWANSWRIDPNRWDAAWLFVKYRSGDGLWRHAQLSNTGNVASGYTMTNGLLDPAAAYNASTNYVVGAFLYRTTAGSGTLTATNVNLVWNYSTAGVVIADVDQVQVYAIEMVYVPQGSFYVGSGGTENGSLTNGSWVSGATLPRQITSEAAITMGPAAGNLWGTSTTGQNSVGPAGSLPATFPKGFNDIYCMKYEVTQQAYVDFLNTLTYTQQAGRTANAPNSAVGTLALYTGFDVNNSIRIQNPGMGSITPTIYGCEWDGDGIFNSFTDGQDFPCNFMSWGDLAGYLDWCGLRPMTELEYEKACRGMAAPVPNEYPWGNAGIHSGNLYNPTAFSTPNDQIDNLSFSTTEGNAIYTSVSQDLFRVGIFAAHPLNTGRMTAGATYYGIMEMAGNVWERTVALGNTNGRAFTGTHGDGILSTNGNADAATWPSPNTADGAGFRGGGRPSPNLRLQVSDRESATNTNSGRNYDFGGRGVRTAP